MTAIDETYATFYVVLGVSFTASNHVLMMNIYECAAAS